MAITTFAGLFRDLGLSSAAIQKKDLTVARQSNLFWFNIPTQKIRWNPDHAANKVMS